MRSRGLLLASILAVGLASPAARAGSELDRASGAVHGDRKSPPTPKSSSSSSSSSTSSSSSSSSDDDDSGNPIAVFLVKGLLFPWSVPNWILESDEAVSHDFSFAPAPYARGSPGWVTRIEPPGSPPASEGDAPVLVPAPPPTKRAAGQLRAEESYLTANLFRTGALARLLLPYRLELDTEWSLFADPNAQTTRYAALGAAHLGLRFAQAEHVVFRTAIGSRHWIDRKGSEHGADLLYGFDIFWGRPVTTTFEGNLGFVGKAFVGRVRGTIGAVIGPVEVFAGYDHVGLMGDGLGAGLGGPLIGLRAFL